MGFFQGKSARYKPALLNTRVRNRFSRTECRSHIFHVYSVTFYCKLSLEFQYNMRIESVKHTFRVSVDALYLNILTCTNSLLIIIVQLHLTYNAVRPYLK